MSGWVSRTHVEGSKNIHIFQCTAFPKSLYEINITKHLFNIHIHMHMATDGHMDECLSLGENGVELPRRTSHRLYIQLFPCQDLLGKTTTLCERTVVKLKVKALLLPTV